MVPVCLNLVRRPRQVLVVILMDDSAGFIGVDSMVCVEVQYVFVVHEIVYSICKAMLPIFLSKRLPRAEQPGGLVNGCLSKDGRLIQIEIGKFAIVRRMQVYLLKSKVEVGDREQVHLFLARGDVDNGIAAKASAFFGIQ